MNFDGAYFYGGVITGSAQSLYRSLCYLLHKDRYVKKLKKFYGKRHMFFPTRKPEVLYLEVGSRPTLAALFGMPYQNRQITDWGVLHTYHDIDWIKLQYDGKLITTITSKGSPNAWCSFRRNLFDYRVYLWKYLPENFDYTKVMIYVASHGLSKITLVD